jgi:N-acetylmuramoyl-L-alanine amidase
MSMSRITHIVLHYSATYDDEDLGAVDIDRMHKARGWSGIGYHYVIRLDGTVEKGRPDSIVGAHVGGQNSGKLGICCIGGLTRATGPNKGVDTRTRAQTESLVALIRALLDKHPGAKVVGHRDLAATQCPGFDVIPWWAEVNRTKPAAEPPRPAADAPARTADVVEGDLHQAEAGDTLWGIARAHGIMVATLAAANGIADAGQVLSVGQVLRVPPGEPQPGPDDPVEYLLDGVERAVQSLREHLTGTFVLVLLATLAFALLPAPALAATIDFGPAVGDLLVGLAAILGTPIAVLLVGVLTRLARRFGIEVEETRRHRLQELVENGIRAGAARLDASLDGRLEVGMRNAVVAETADYLARHGATTIRKLGGDPQSQALLQELVLGRGGRLLGIGR